MSRTSILMPCALALSLLTCGDSAGRISAAPPQSRLAQIQAASVADRDLERPGFETFHAATSVPAVSPAASKASFRDLRVRYTNLMNPEEMEAVVLKPRAVGGVYEIPKPPPLADAYRFLKDQLDIAAQRGAGLVKFPPFHVFEIKPLKVQGRHLKLEGLKDAVVDLNGSTLQFTQVSVGMVIEDCQRVTLRNGSIRGRALLATIARVVADDSPAGVRFEVLPEFREALEATTLGKPQLLTIGSAEKSPEGGWRLQPSGYAEMFVNRGESTNNFQYAPTEGSFVAISPLNGPLPFKAGEDHVWLLHQNNGGHAVLLDNENGAGLEDITLERLNFVNIPGMVITGEVVRGLHLTEINIEKDDQDPLAFFAASSDGVHINGNGGDIVVENCNFGPSGDDKINIKGNYWRISALNRTTGQVEVVPAERNTSVNRWGWAGQKLVFVDHDFAVLGTSELQENSMRDNGKKHQLQLSSIPEGVRVGSIIGNVDNGGGRTVIRNNRFGPTRAQGVLVQTSHMVVDNNFFDGIAGPAIKLNLALDDWYEAINPSNILIQNNRFTRSALSREKSNELVYLHEVDGHGDPVQILDNIKITGNRIVTP